MKILYAANNNNNSRIQLKRFLEAMYETKHQIKIAAYIKSSPPNFNIDWTLDCLLNIYKPNILSLDNDYLSIYYDQIKQFRPDLIISDLEYFTSYIAMSLNIPLWQCSSSLINMALAKQEKYNLGVFKYYAHVFNRNPLDTQKTINIIDNSNRNFVYSHFGDISSPPIIENKFEWIRPYHEVGKQYIPCQHYLVACLLNNDKKILNVVKRYPDSVVFSESMLEHYNELTMKTLDEEKEYFCNLRNSDIFVCQGQSSCVADAFYNGKYALIYPDYEDAESIINSHLTSHLSLGTKLTYSDDIASFKNFPQITPFYKNGIQFLHEKIEEIL